MSPEHIVQSFGGCQINIRGVIVEFWGRKDEKLRPLLSIDVYEPQSWTLRRVLDEIEESVDDL
jgi:hypothetical protein